jgi:predicted DNA-binding transcriptional regulator YafY
VTPPSGRATLLRIEEIHRRLRHVTPDGTYRVSVATLADELEVAESTIKEDLLVFELLFGPPLDYCPRRRTKYYTRPFELRPLLWLESDESLALLVAVRLASHSRMFPLGRDLERALEKISPMLAGAASFGPAVLDPVLSTSDASTSETDARHFSRLCEAIAQRREVRISYRKAKHGAEIETRVVHPLHWFIRPDACLLVLHEPKVGDRRNFELVRMQSVEFTGATFEWPTGFDLKHYLSGTFGRFIGPPVHDVVVRFEPEFVPLVRERPWQVGQTLTELGGGRADATYHVCHTGDLEQYVLRTGGLAQVVSPPEVRNRIHAAAAKIMAQHD